MPRISFTAIIPTKNRAHDLTLAVRSLLQQSVLPAEVLIVDQSPDDQSRICVEQEFASALAQVDNVKLTYIHDIEITGGATARNRAMQVASGDIWLFLDDDVVLEPDFIEQLMNAYARYPEATGVSGVVTNYPKPPLFFRVWNTLFVRGPFHDDRQPIYWHAEQLRHSDPIPVTRFGGGLMSFRAETIRNCIFDPNLTGVSDGEDVQFCSRLPEGSVLLIAPRARLVHNCSPIGRDRDHWLRREARSTHYLFWSVWDHGIYNRICLAWLTVGYVSLSFIGALRRGSLEPWRAFRAGVKDAKSVFMREMQ
ncbi:MAG TPA: glycosyltransferase family 2 protein [Clostridia bacterium]|nr:glycosyltransferase family 2 protein [Clostridia bacterium]